MYSGTVGVQCTVDSRCTVFCIKCIVYSVHCTVYCSVVGAWECGGQNLFLYPPNNGHPRCLLHCGQCTLIYTQCTLSTAYYTLHTEHYTLNTVHCTPHRKLHTQHCTLHIRHNINCTLLYSVCVLVEIDCPVERLL